MMSFRVFLPRAANACLIAAVQTVLAAQPATPPAQPADQPVSRLAPAPADIEVLRFNEFFEPPGDRGLAFTPRLRSLAGKRVQLTGYMAQEERGVPGRLLLAPFPFTLHEDEYGLCDDLPPAVVFVRTPDQEERKLPFTPGLLRLTGTLELGARDEPDGRVSHVRLVLDSPEAALNPQSHPAPPPPSIAESPADSIPQP